MHPTQVNPVRSFALDLNTCYMLLYTSRWYITVLSTPFKRVPLRVCGTAFEGTKPPASGSNCREEVPETLSSKTETEASTGLILVTLMVRVQWRCVLRIAQATRRCADKTLPLYLSRESPKMSVSVTPLDVCSFPDSDVKGNNVSWCPRCT